MNLNNNDYKLEELQKKARQEQHEITKSTILVTPDFPLGSNHRRDLTSVAVKQRLVQPTSVEQKKSTATAATDNVLTAIGANYDCESYSVSYDEVTNTEEASYVSSISHDDEEYQWNCWSDDDSDDDNDTDDGVVLDLSTAGRDGQNDDDDSDVDDKHQYCDDDEKVGVGEEDEDDDEEEVLDLSTAGCDETSSIINEKDDDQTATSSTVRTNPNPE